MWSLHSMSPPLKRRGPNFWPNMSSFQTRYQKGQKLGLWETNDHELLWKFACDSKYCYLLGHLLCIPCLKDSKECYYSDLYIKHQILEILSQNFPQNFGCKMRRGCGGFFKFWVEKRGFPNLSKIIGGNQSITDCSLHFLKKITYYKSYRLHSSISEEDLALV